VDTLRHDAILAAAGLPAEHPLHLLPVTDSTNLVLRRMAARGAAHGTAVLAETQTAGRGRLGRSFLSPTGGVYLSVLLRPQVSPQELMPLTALMAEAARQAVSDACGLAPGIKWVNDLVVNGKKLAGILTELSVSPDGRADWAICGVGINCNAPADAFQPEVRQLCTGLSQCLGRPVDRSDLAGALLRRILEAAEFSDVPARMERYRKACITLGQQVRVLGGGETYEALARDVDGEGALLAEDARGVLRRVFSGEVSVRGLWDYV